MTRSGVDSSRAVERILALDWPAETAAARRVRAEVREFLQGELAAGRLVPRVDTWLSGVDTEFSRELGRRGWLGITWPKEFGGRQRTSIERYAVIEELLAFGAPVAAHWIAERQVGPSLLRYGSDGQRRDLLPRIAAGECYVALGMSEPDSGSDLASVRTAARRNAAGDWVLNGVKLWTSNAHISHYIVVLARTSPVGDNRHAGLSQFIVDLATPGVSVNPVRILDGGHHFNEVVFTDVEVPAAMLLGEAGAGWHQVTSELAYERSGPERFLSTFALLNAFADVVGRTREPAQQATLGRLSARLMGLRQLSLCVAAGIDNGSPSNVAAAMVKDMGTRLEGDVIDEIRRVLDTSSGGDLVALLVAAQLHAPGYTLRGGTNEILRGIVARELGLR